jgi:hypothetical protein
MRVYHCKCYSLYFEYAFYCNMLEFCPAACYTSYLAACNYVHPRCMCSSLILHMLSPCSMGGLPQHMHPFQAVAACAFSHAAAWQATPAHSHLAPNASPTAAHVHPPSPQMHPPLLCMCSPSRPRCIPHCCACAAPLAPDAFLTEVHV